MGSNGSQLRTHSGRPRYSSISATRARATRPYADAGPAAGRGNSLPNAVLARKYSHRLVITLTGEFKCIVNSGGKEKKKKGRETVLDDLIVKP